METKTYMPNLYKKKFGGKRLYPKKEESVRRYSLFWNDSQGQQ
jgi:hypothetical protein